MTDFRQQDLISGYLDGELSAENKERAEQLLASNPEARQLLEELRALSNTLRSMPRQSVGEDLSSKVLRRAERAMLEDADGNGAAPSSLSTPSTLQAQRVEAPRAPRSRSWVWAAAALAAALMIMFVDRSMRRAPENVALAPSRAPSATDAEPEGAREEAGTDVATLDADDRPAPTSARAPGTEHAAKGAPSGRAGLEEFAKKPGAANFARKGAVANSASQAEASESLHAREKEAQAQPSADTVARGNRHRDATLGSGGGELAGLAFADEGQGIGSDDLLVVQVDIDPKAMQSGAFDKVLARQAIVWETPAGFLDTDGEGKKSNATDNRRAQDQPSSQTPVPSQPAIANQQATGQRRAEPTEPVDAVYVEAPVAQIRATLDELAAQPDSYVSMAIEPAPGEPSQQPLTAYNYNVDSQQRALARRAASSLREGNNSDKALSAAQSPVDAVAPSLAAKPETKQQKTTGKNAPSAPSKLPANADIASQKNKNETPIQRSKTESPEERQDGQTLNTFGNSKYRQLQNGIARRVRISNERITEDALKSQVDQKSLDGVRASAEELAQRNQRKVDRSEVLDKQASSTRQKDITKRSTQAPTDEEKPTEEADAQDELTRTMRVLFVFRLAPSATPAQAAPNASKSDPNP